ncbi:hypothetical protein OAP63_09245 [Vibrio sp.]|nr:hypothetical protein [Vibrio sp.]
MITITIVSRILGFVTIKETVKMGCDFAKLAIAICNILLQMGWFDK